MSNYYVRRSGPLKGPFTSAKIKTSIQKGEWKDDFLVAKSENGPWHPVAAIELMDVDASMETASVSTEESVAPTQNELLARIEEAVGKGQAFHPGTHDVGTIPEGEYLCIYIESNSKYYTEKMRAENVCIQEIIAFGYVYHHSVGDVEAGCLMLKRELIEEFGFKSGRQLFEIHQALPEYNFSGIYHVGSDVPPGEHSFKSVGSAMITILDGPPGNGSTVDFKSFTGSEVLELTSGQYIELTGAKIADLS